MSATEGVAEVAEEVAQQATHVAEAAREIDTRALTFGAVGFVMGAAAGGAAAYFYLRKKMETKYAVIAAEEVSEMAAIYRAKKVALENQADKPDLADLVREQGYTGEDPEDVAAEEQTSPPMAVTPPNAVVERAREVEETPEVPEAPPEPEVRNVFQDHAVVPEDDWDWAKERTLRTPMTPYVIHIDEREGEDTFDSVTYTYYEGDDTLCNERDEIMSPQERERVVGEVNLGKFGHGSGDADTVYIRNNPLEMDIEVVRSPNSYAEEVRGLEPEPPELRHSYQRRGKPPFDDDEQ